MLLSVAILASGHAFAAGPARGAEKPSHHQSERIDVSNAVPVHRNPKRAPLALTSALESSALESSALESSALESSALESSALESGALESGVTPSRPGSRVVKYIDPPIAQGSTLYESTCGCESVCDCPIEHVNLDPACGIEPVCGVETWIEPTCGCEGVGCDSCCTGYDPACGCNACRGTVGGFIDGLFPRLNIPWRQIDLSAGVAGFSGPMNFANTSASDVDRRGTGSFGFYEGFNKGTSLRFFGTDLAWQSGLRFTQSNLSGAGFSDETRSQVFGTSGVFRKVDFGFQFGLVMDYLYEDWYYRGDLLQLRGELSWVRRNRDVFGLKFAAGVDDDSATTSVLDATGGTVANQIQFGATTQYRLFYRKHFARCGVVDCFAGWTEQEDGLLGFDADIPISSHLLWNTSATYLIPDEGTGNGGNEQEGWNLSFGFTYRPCGLGVGSRYSRPLLKVADNGVFMVDRK